MMKRKGLKVIRINNSKWAVGRKVVDPETGKKKPVILTEFYPTCEKAAWIKQLMEEGQQCATD